MCLVLSVCVSLLTRRFENLLDTYLHCVSLLKQTLHFRICPWRKMSRYLLAHDKFSRFIPPEQQVHLNLRPIVHVFFRAFCAFNFLHVALTCVGPTNWPKQNLIKYTALCVMFFTVTRSYQLHEIWYPGDAKEIFLHIQGGHSISDQLSN